MLGQGSRLPAPHPAVADFLCPSDHDGPTALHHRRATRGVHLCVCVPAPGDSRASDAMCHRVSWRKTLLLVRPFVFQLLVFQLLRPLLTSRAVLPRWPFNHEARSPRVRTHAFTARPPDLRRLILDHESFAEFGPLALIGTALYPVLVHRPAASLPASSPHSVALMQLRFTSFAVVSSWEDFHLQACARAGRNRDRGRPSWIGPLPHHRTCGSASGGSSS